VRALIADDEANLAEHLRTRLAALWPQLEILPLAANGLEALRAIQEESPAVAFLDIRMPGLTGLEVAAGAAEASPATQVVFVTAYNQYALDAFDRGAVDYLLKPIVPERLAETVRRVRARIAEGPGDRAGLAAVLEQLRTRLPAESKAPPLQWITASVGRESRLIQVEDVAYFKADDKYTVVATAEGEALIRKPIRELLDVLDPRHFKQIHRSTIVNLKAIAAITRDDSGRGTIRLKTRPETLPVSLTFMPVFKGM